MRKVETPSFNLAFIAVTADFLSKHTFPLHFGRGETRPRSSTSHFGLIDLANLTASTFLTSDDLKYPHCFCVICPRCLQQNPLFSSCKRKQFEYLHKSFPNLIHQAHYFHLSVSIPNCLKINISSPFYDCQRGELH